MSRRAKDFYETAPWQVETLMVNLPELEDARSIFCPCVGDGSLLSTLQDYLPLCEFTTNDIDPRHPADFHLDATMAQAWAEFARAPFAPFDWVIDNPPFNAALEILARAERDARKGVAFMARVSFTEPTEKRAAWLASHPYQKRITMERYSFTGNGKTDSTTTDWLIWAKTKIAPPFGVVAAGFRP